MKRQDEICRPDFSSIPDTAIGEIHRQAELCLQGTMQFALAADARANTLTAVFSAAALGFLTLSVNLWLKTNELNEFIIASVTASIFLIAAAASCALASRPVQFSVTGYEPRKLVELSKSGEAWIKRYSAEDIQVRIDRNRMTLERGGEFLKRGRQLAVSAIPFAAIAYAIWFLSHHHFHFL